MPSFLSLSENHLKQLKEDGVIILPNMISSDIVNDIRKDTLSWYKNISFNNRISSSIIGNNQWIDHVGLCSLKALKLVLDTNLIKFLKKYFNSDISVGSISIQKKIFSENGIPLHSDLGKGLSIFIYLTKPDKKSGVTEFIKKSHLTKINKKFKIQNKIDDATYLDINKSPFSEKDIIETKGEVGTVVIFHRAIWHQLPKFSAPGREIIMIQYTNNESSSCDHLIKNSFLNLLLPIQKDVFLNNSSIKKDTGLSKLGSDTGDSDVYKIPSWKMLLYVIRYKLFSRAQS